LFANTNEIAEKYINTEKQQTSSAI
jgi:hypothetical protein